MLYFLFFFFYIYICLVIGFKKKYIERNEIHQYSIH